jgi:hypothetical protein
MGLPVTVYRNTDAGAPAVPTKPSEWITVLKKCLVEGYGAKTPLGWVLDFEDASNVKAVFRNSAADGGSGGAVQIEAHSAGANTAGSLVRITCANSITGIDSFFNKVGYRTMATSNSLGNVRGWMIIGTSRGFWLIQESGETLNNSYNTGPFSHREYYFIGDVESFVPNDMSTFTLITTGNAMIDSASTAYGENLGSLGAGAKFSCGLYDTDGGSGSATYSSDWTAVSPYAYETITTDPQVIGVPINLKKISLCHTAYTLVKLPACRGMATGIFGTNFVGYGGHPLPLIRTFEGNEYVLVTGMQSGSLFIQMSGEWYV